MSMRWMALIVLFLTHATFAKGKTLLECVNIQRVGDGGPFLVVAIDGKKVLDSAELDQRDPVLVPYHQVDGFEYSTFDRTEGHLIAADGHPFAGHQDFLMRFGAKMARLILPHMLERKIINETRLGGVAPNEANGMIILETAQRHDHAQPDTVVWLNCHFI